MVVGRGKGEEEGVVGEIIGERIDKRDWKR